MVLKSGFELVEIADEHMVIPVGDHAASFQGVVALSEAAYFLLGNLKTPKTSDELLNLLINEYEVDKDTAKKDLDDLVKKLLDLGIVEE